MRRFSSLAAIAIAATASTAANAANGPYIGGSAGYAWTNARAETSTVFSNTGYFATTSVPAIAAVGIQHVHPRGIDAGIDIGYDMHSGNFLFGVAADASILHGSDTKSGTSTYPCCAPTAFTVAQTVKTRWMATVRARAGIDVKSATIYLTGGYAGVKARYSEVFTDTFATAHESGSTSKFKGGWVVGGGADVNLSGNWTLQPEYLHAEFGHLNTTSTNLAAFTPPIAFPSSVFTHRARLKTDIVRVGFHYHF